MVVVHLFTKCACLKLCGHKVGEFVIDHGSVLLTGNQITIMTYLVIARVHDETVPRAAIPTLVLTWLWEYAADEPINVGDP